MTRLAVSVALSCLLAVGVLLGAWTPATAATADPPAAADTVDRRETPDVEGAANPLAAPALPRGQATDTILPTEVLWYALPAVSGQQVSVTVTVQGRPDGAVVDATIVEAIVRDAQRLPVQEAVVPFDGRTDAVAAPPPAEVPRVTGEGRSAALLSVALLSREGHGDGGGVGYRVVLQVDVTGDPSPTVSAPPAPGATAAPAPDATVAPTQPADGAAAPPQDPPVPATPTSTATDLLPVALVALALGGVGGFELSRRGL